MNTYSNPVHRGFFPDPSVIRVGNDYYMVNSSFQYFPAIPISHSTDMVTWRVVGHAVTENTYADLSDIPDSHGFWAPDISYHNGTFYIFATLRLSGDGTRGNNVLRRQMVVTSRHPAGPYSAPQWLEVDDIDPSHFVDADGTHYMMIAAGCRAVRLSDDCSRVEGEPRTVWEGTGEGHAEGPHLWRHNGWYYSILAEGGTGYGHGINSARSRTLFGKYEPCPHNPVMRQTDPDALIQRAGHGKPVQAPDGSWWMYYLCGRQNGGKYTTIGRETALDPITFTDDGWFTVNGGRGPSSMQNCPGLAQQTVDAAESSGCQPSAALSNCSGSPAHSVDGFYDDFTLPTLSPEWQFVRNPDMGSWSLSDRPGCFRIYTRDGVLSERRAKNTLVCREREFAFTAVTKLDFYPSKDGEQAGLVCYYSTNTYIRWSLCCEGGRKLRLVANRALGEEIIADFSDIAEQPLFLRLNVKGQKRSFDYGYDGKTWIPGGSLEPCVFLCDEGVPNERKRHTGTLTGIYANNGGCGSRIPADFDFFRITFTAPD